MNETEKSPESLRISLAAAMSLGLRGGNFYRDASLHCLNLLVTYPDGCHANCSYCGLSRRSIGEYSERSFIRVDWPAHPTKEIIARARTHNDSFERICISMIMNPAALADTITLVSQLNDEIELPVSVLVNPSAMEQGDLEALRLAGADMVSVALDAVTEELFDANRGEGVNGPHRWKKYWDVLDEAAIVFGRNRFGCHLIAGLGETESELLQTVGRLREMGARSHLFSFYPEKGSMLEKAEPCSLEHFRRIQLARFLIDYDIVSLSNMDFDEKERIVGFGVQGGELEKLVESGVPFMTSGCPGKTRLCACNRPFGDGPPSEIRSFPFNLDSDDVLTVKKQLATYPEALTSPVLDVEA